ncbi:cytochrome c oxidase subunit 3 [Cupriavidus sp. H19C3]|uniref:cytochrome c oxidase subunit 3 n=1 Tax=Cupriavidus sp. H19C3 TaxID=3241603 RepID=UPI003BF77D23
MGAHAGAHLGGPRQQDTAATLGMWVFLGTEAMFFGPLFLGYGYGRLLHPDGFAAAARHTDLLLGTCNTAVLLTSSLLMAVAGLARGSGMARLTARLLWAVATLGMLFLIVKGVEYRHEWQAHLFPAAGAGFEFADARYERAARLFFVLYFCMTALHALHMIIGIAMVTWLALALTRGAARRASHARVEITALYWHFVDIVWLFLYALLYLYGRSGA